MTACCRAAKKASGPYQYATAQSVQPDPSRLISYGLSLNQVIAAIEANNVSRGANYIEQNGEGYVVRASGRVENIEDISQIVVATRAMSCFRRSATCGATQRVSLRLLAQPAAAS